MEASAPKTSQGSRRLRFSVAAVALSVFLLGNDNAGAQITRIRSRDGDQTITHSLKSGPQAFAPLRWDIQQGFSYGCVVEWTATPFTHTVKKSSQADCALAIELVQGSRHAGWQVTKPVDSTSVASGKNNASVTLVSAESGTARVELSVQFQGATMASLAAGDYQTTVVGTITGL